MIFLINIIISIVLRKIIILIPNYILVFSALDLSSFIS
jgi:hypothetical protein